VVKGEMSSTKRASGDTKSGAAAMETHEQARPVAGTARGQGRADEARHRYDARNTRYGIRNTRLPTLRRARGGGKASQEGAGRKNTDDRSRAYAEVPCEPEVITVTNKGRPRILGDRPMTNAERSRRSRAKRRAQRETPEDAGVRRAEEALEALCVSRNIHAGSFEATVARKAINCLAGNKIAEFVRLVDCLPPRIVGADVLSPVVTPSAAKAKLLALVEANIEADKYEEQREVERLRIEVAQLRARLGEPEGDLDCCSTQQSNPEPRVITPSTGDITPPGERTDVGVRKVFDAPKPVPPVLDLTPVEPADPRRPGEWDASASGKAWHEWRERNPHLVDYL
jgi:hypothetical protein